MDHKLKFALDTLGALRATQGLHVVPAIICKDGTKLSIQGSSQHLCLPREDFRHTFAAYEVLLTRGKAKLEPAEFMEHCCDPEEGAMLFAFVPADKLASFVARCGGLDEARTAAEINKMHRGKFSK